MNYNFQIGDRVSASIVNMPLMVGVVEKLLSDDQLSIKCDDGRTFQTPHKYCRRIIVESTDQQPATLAKYFHRAEVDGQAAMIGFQTYAELMHHLEPETYPNPLDHVCNSCGVFWGEQHGPGCTGPDFSGFTEEPPTIREK